MSFTIGDGRPLRLGKPLGKPGGEGAVYSIMGEPRSVAKILHRAKRSPVREAKINAMLASKPPLRAIEERKTGHKVPTLAWPEAMVLEDGVFAGFVMGALDLGHAAEIAIIENPQRRKNRPWTAEMGLGLRSFVAMNLAFVVGQVHHVGAVIGDFNERNVIVSRALIVSIIDCDSMQIRDQAGRYHLCEVFSPGFLAPEMVGRDLRRVVRPVSSDLFTLAVHIYCLLMDRHPFRNGIYSGPGDKPSAEALAREGQWRGRARGVLRPTEVNGLDPRSFLPQSTVALFERAFESGSQEPRLRPSALEWQQELGRFIGDWKP